MAKFLDKEGLTHFWSKIKTLLGGKADQTSLDQTNQALARVDSTVGSEDGGLVKDLNDLAATVANKANSSDVGNLEVNINQKLAGKSDTGHTHDAATTSANGFMTKDMVTKLNGIATGANKTTVDTALSSTSTNPVQNKVINTALAGKSDTGHGHDVATTSANGFMSAAMVAEFNNALSKLSGIADGANKTTVDTSLSTSSTNPVQNKVITTSINTLNTFMNTTVPNTYAKKTDIATAYKPMGSVSTIPSITTDMDGGEVYNMTAEFTTTSTFVEGAGKKYPAGTNIVLTADKKWDVLAGFVDLSPYATTGVTDDLQDQIDAIEAVTGAIDSITTTEIDTMMSA